MKKTFQFKVPGTADARVIEAIKNDVRKYAKRERRKKLPEGFDLWDFNCKVGADEATAQPTPVKEVTVLIEALANAGGEKVYVEILSFAAKRDPKPEAAPSEPDVGETSPTL